MVRHDVDEDAQTGRVRGARERVEPGPTAELGIHGRGVDHVVAVLAAGLRGEDRREVQPVDAEAVEIRHEVGRGREREVAVELEPVRRDRSGGAHVPNTSAERPGRLTRAG